MRTAANWFLANDVPPAQCRQNRAILFGTRQQLAKHLDNKVHRLGDCDVKYGSTVKILGVQLDLTLSLVQWFHKSMQSSGLATTYHVRSLRHIRKYLTLEGEATKTIAHGLGTFRLDNCNSLLFNTSKSNISKLQHTQNNQENDDARPLLNQLHWLPIEDRIKFMIAVFTHKVRSSSELHYLRKLDKVAIR